MHELEVLDGGLLLPLDSEDSFSLLEVVAEEVNGEVAFTFLPLDQEVLVVEQAHRLGVPLTVLGGVGLEHGLHLSDRELGFLDLIVPEVHPHGGLPLRVL